MKRTKYTSEFKEEAVKQVIDKGHPVPDVAQRLHSHTRRLVVFGCGVGFAFACGSGLEHGLKDADESGSGCTHDGCMEKKAKWLGHHPFVSGNSVR